jgi:hypothetical protein
MRMTVRRRTSPSVDVAASGFVDTMLGAETVIVQSVCMQTDWLSSFRT